MKKQEQKPNNFLNSFFMLKKKS